MTMSRSDQLAAARDYYDTHDTSEEMAQGTWIEAEPGLDVKAKVAASMEVFAVRLPQPVLEQLRAEAAAAGTTTGALIRLWLEQRLAASGPDTAEQVLQTVREMFPQMKKLVELDQQRHASPRSEVTSAAFKSSAVIGGGAVKKSAARTGRAGKSAAGKR